MEDAQEIELPFDPKVVGELLVDELNESPSPFSLLVQALSPIERAYPDVFRAVAEVLTRERQQCES